MYGKIIVVADNVNSCFNVDLLNEEIRKNRLQVVGVLFNEINLDADNVKVFKSFEEIKDIEFDYFITLRSDKKVYDEIIDEHHFKQKIIPAHAFKVNHFDFRDYIMLLDNVPSVICNNHWGGLLFNRLGLRYNSPFVNTKISSEDFIRLAQNFDHYMSQELKQVKSEEKYPIAKLDDILINFDTYDSFKDAKNDWDRRKQRINYDNLVFEAIIEDIDVARQFDSLDLSKRLCFCPESLSDRCIDFTYLSKGNYDKSCNETAFEFFPLFNLIDLLLHFSPETWYSSLSKNNYEGYLNYVNSEYGQIELRRFADLDDSVRWELDDKIEAYKFVDDYGVVHPKIIDRFEDVEKLRALKNNGELPDRFVLKISNRSTAKGVLLLDKIDDTLYFENFTSRMLNINGIIGEEKKVESKKVRVLRSTYFFIEELIENFIPDYTIPYDYKVFCVNGIPKLIVQVSRNVGHMEVALFDGNFIPLREGIDWFLKPNKADLAIPIIPPSACEIISQSIKIAKESDPKQVRIDWFDDGEKPVFGEFTFCSGSSFTGTFTLPKDMWDNIDRTHDEEYYVDYPRKGYSIDSKRLHEVAGIGLKHRTREYMELLQRSSQGNVKAMRQMVAYFNKLSKREKNKSRKLLYAHLETAWEEVLSQQNPHYTEGICRKVDYNYGFIQSKTDYFTNRVNETRESLYISAQKSSWYRDKYYRFLFNFCREEFDLSNETFKQQINALPKISYDDVVILSREAEKNIKNKRKLLPVNGVNWRKYTYLFAKCILNPNENILALPVELPPDQGGNHIDEDIPKADYIALVSELVDFVDAKGYLPNNLLYKGYKIKPFLYCYEFARILNYYDENGSLPDSWNFNSNVYEVKKQEKKEKAEQETPSAKAGLLSKIKNKL
ncbi:DUF1919 domain-containing protein [Methanobrevibacter sp.]|uniref:DUF1919 domain-containing protein n=1 Tax=Methanobrevibacter sp. TaxID=66852 RepID=UPI0026E0F6FB|nr:DUF1919 domain-containing protein [Methanobrevibacter sp.]MDO5859583.1 DUF1919 domain-containing protein [Methanobrevibacter sp.]